MSHKFLWLFEQDVTLITPLVTGALWAMGGGGVLAFRRFGVGVFLAICALSLGVPWYLALISVGTFFATTSLPYGDSVRGKLGILYYPFLFLIGVLYGLSNLGLCIYSGRWLTLVGGSLVSGLFFSLASLASQTKDFKKIVVWKVVEIGMGIIVGIIALLLY